MKCEEFSVYNSLKSLLDEMNYTKNDITKILWYSESDHEWHYFTQDWFFSFLRNIDNNSSKKLIDFVIYLRDGSKITHKNYSPYEVFMDPSILWDYHPAEFNPDCTFKIPHSLLK